MNNKYFVLRHGQSKANVARLVLSDLEDGKKEEYTLTAEGENQVELSVKKAKEGEFLAGDTIIYSSPFSRTKKTAEIAKDVLGVKSEINFDDRLRERFFGDWEKSDYSIHEKVWAADEKNPEHKENNVESEKEVLFRLTSLLKDLDDTYSDKKILLVSHGDPITMLLASFNKITSNKYRESQDIKTAEIRELKY